MLRPLSFALCPLAALFAAKHTVLRLSPFDLHVLGTPPAFVLSQDQTLNIWYLHLLASSAGSLLPASPAFQVKTVIERYSSSQKNFQTL